MHQARLSFLRKTTPSCTRDLGILHLLFERRAKCFEIRFKEPDVATHYAEMGNLLPLDPKIHSLRTHSKKIGSFWHGPGVRIAVRGCADLHLDQGIFLHGVPLASSLDLPSSVRGGVVLCCNSA